MACTSPPAAATSAARRRTSSASPRKSLTIASRIRASYSAHRRRDRGAPFGVTPVERASDLTDDAASRARRQLAHSVTADDDQANRIATRVRDRRETDGDVARRFPFAKRALGICHRRRRIHDDQRRHDRAVLREADVRTIASREQPPVYALRIVTLTVDAILTRAQAPTREVGSGARLAARRRPAAAPATSRRELRRAASRGSRYPISHPPFAAGALFRGPCVVRAFAAARRGFRSPEPARDGSPRPRSARR